MDDEVEQSSADGQQVGAFDTVDQIAQQAQQAQQAFSTGRSRRAFVQGVMAGANRRAQALKQSGIANALTWGGRSGQGRI